jgi:hypothetical protein
MADVETKERTGEPEKGVEGEYNEMNLYWFFLLHVTDIGLMLIICRPTWATWPIPASSNIIFLRVIIVR